MFLLTTSTNIDIIGKEYPQSQKLGTEYLNFSEKSMQLIDYNKPVDYELTLNSFLVQYRAKLTDMLSCSSTSNSFIISEKLLNIFLSSNIEHYQYFEANVIYHKKDYKYYFFFIYGQDYSVIDYQNMHFWAMDQAYYQEGRTRKLDVKIDTPDKIINWQKIKTYPYVEYRYLEYGALKLNYANIHTDMIRAPFLLSGGYFVSEALKNKIEEAKCTGVDFRTKDWRERPIL